MRHDLWDEESMKIALIIDSLASGGAERQSVCSAIELARRGHHVELIRYHARNDFEALLDEHGICSTYIPKSKLAAATGWKLADYLQARSFDVIHAFKFSATLHIQVAASRSRLGCVFGGYRAQVKRPWNARLISRLLADRLTGWIVNSESVRQAVRKYLGARRPIHVVPNGIDVNAFESHLTVGEARAKHGIPQQGPLVTLAANFRPMKNHPMFFRMGRILAQRFPTIRFAIAGHGPLADHIMNICRRQKLESRTHILGQCRDMSELYRASDVVVLTSHANTEGLPNVVLEASAAGVPPVSTRNGAQEIIVHGRTGFLVDDNDHATMADRVSDLLSNESQRDAMGRAARQRVSEEFSLHKLGDRLLSVYQRARPDQIAPAA
jgi:glycosyltransferase involved in cell wall biosynthesis